MSHPSQKIQPDHISDLLPAYINGTIDQEDRMRVHTHLGSCAACRDDLAEWETIASATRMFASTLHAPEAQGRVDHPPKLTEPKAVADPHRRTLDPETAHRPASKRTLRDRQEKRAMQAAFAIPQRRTRRHRASQQYVLFALTLAILVGIGGIALLNGSGGPSDSIRLPAAMQVSPEASPESACRHSEGALDRMELMGPTGQESLVMLPPPGGVEGRPGIEASMLPKGGEPIGDAVLAELTITLEGLVTCMNEGDAEGTIAWTTDDYWRRSNEIGSGINPAKVRSFVPLVGPASGNTPIPSLENARILDGGRIGAVVRPGFDVPSYSYDYYVFVDVDGRWLIDEAVHVTEWTTVEVVVTDDGFTPEEIKVPAAPAKLVVRNDGAGTHSMVIPELLIRIEVAPGESGSENLKHPGGRFAFHSDMPGDPAEAFSGTLVIGREAEATPVAPDSRPEGQTLDGLGEPVASVTITMRPPIEYEPNRVSILADRDVEVTLFNDPSASNTGADFLTPVAGGGFEGSVASFTIDELGISLELKPGETRTIVVNAPEGVYAFYSKIPGHTEVGMSGTLHVYDVATPAP